MKIKYKKNIKKNILLGIIVESEDSDILSHPDFPTLFQSSKRLRSKDGGTG